MQLMLVFMSAILGAYFTIEAVLFQRLSVAVQRGNAASVLGTMKMGSQEEEFFV